MLIRKEKLEILLIKGGEAVFSCKTKIEMGISYLKELNIRKLLLVTDPYFVTDGTAQRLLTLSGAAQTAVFDKIAPDPTVELVAEGTAVLKDFQPDTVVALGGGSAMDCAKAMTYFAGERPRLVMIPTTSGSGSEVTNFAVLTRGTVKYPLVDEKLRPDVAILEDSLLKSLPKSLIADAGFDVLGHALEAYTAKNANGFTDALASGAFATVLTKLPDSFSGNTAVRGQIHEASTMAGMAFTQAGLGLCHAMAHVLGATYHIPHGRLIAMLLPPVIACNAPGCMEKYAALARSAGLGGTADTMAVRNLRNAVVRLRKELQMPTCLKAAGVDPQRVWQDREKLVSSVLEDPCCDTNPLIPDRTMICEILEAVTDNG